ncbi:MAG: hypothetical protein COV76_02995 [Candidatus Omnitrophica bacterium CG11_big_fil_rev_8_21_14_0_20_64_10]|nr:MAG: hypothetical protein COV76_02995 [Candidatus Omnitrophica bacterium CG11_big_fil_rev_8_21_14_0_20_64_10]
MVLWAALAVPQMVFALRVGQPADDPTRAAGLESILRSPSSAASVQAGLEQTPAGRFQNDLALELTAFWEEEEQWIASFV